MLYFPTALIVEQLPAGLASVGQVPALQDMPAKSHAAKLKQYAAAIRRLSKVYATAEHKVRTKAEYDAYMIWLDAWSRLQGFGALVVVDEEVRAAPCKLRCSARRDGCGGGRTCTFALKPARSCRCAACERRCDRWPLLGRPALEAVRIGVLRWCSAGHGAKGDGGGSMVP